MLLSVAQQEWVNTYLLLWQLSELEWSSSSALH